MTIFVDRETTVEAAWLNMVDGVVTDPALTALAALTPAADKIPYYTGASAASLADFTTFARTLVAQPSAASALAALGGVPADSPTFTTKLTLGGSGFRFLADFSNATVANRALFQSSTVNSVTSICATPNGSATTSAWVAYNSSDPATATLAAIQCYNNSDLTAALSYVDIRSGTSAHSITTGNANGGTTLPLQISSGGKPVTFNTTGITDFGSASSDARIKVFQRRDLANPYGLIISAYNVTFENDFFMGQTATGFALGNYQAFALELKTNNTNGIYIGGDQRVNVGPGVGAGSAELQVTKAGACELRVTDGSSIFQTYVGGGSGVVGMVGAQPLILRTNATERFRILANGNATFTTADDAGGTQHLIAGTTKAIRIYTNTVGSIIEGVDNTGTGSFQPLYIGGSLLQFSTSGTERLGFETDGRIYTKSIHNNGTVTGTTKQYLCSGTYTPSVTAVANCSSPSGAKSHWTRVGNVVTVTGRFTVTITAANTVTTARVSLPIASAIASTNDVNGLSMPDNQSVAAYGGVIFGAAATDDAQVNWRSSASTGAIVQHFTFQYEVL